MLKTGSYHLIASISVGQKLVRHQIDQSSAAGTHKRTIVPPKETLKTHRPKRKQKRIK